jgi:hypothetical protein
MAGSAVMPSSLMGSATKDLVLRVCGSTRHGQVVRLRSAKCTIGSGPRCTLRLRARGVAPVHCLILRGGAGTVVRRWSPDTRLNDQAFTDADLVPGDHLSIGPIDLEVLESGRSPEDPPPSVENDHRPQEEELDAQRRALEEEKQQWRAECAEVQGQLSEQMEQLKARQAELDAQRESLEKERKQWQAECAASATQLRERASELDVRQAELDARQNALKEEHGQYEPQPAEAQRQSDAQAEPVPRGRTPRDVRGSAGRPGRRASANGKRRLVGRRRARGDASGRSGTGTEG